MAEVNNSEVLGKDLPQNSAPVFYKFKELPPELRLKIFVEAFHNGVLDPIQVEKGASVRTEASEQSMKAWYNLRWASQEARETVNQLSHLITYLSFAQFIERTSNGPPIQTEHLYIHASPKSVEIPSSNNTQSPNNANSCYRLTLTKEMLCQQQDYFDTETENTPSAEVESKLSGLRKLAGLNFHTLSYSCEDYDEDTEDPIEWLDEVWKTLGINRVYPRLELSVSKESAVTIFGDPKHIDWLDSDHTLLTCMEVDIDLTEEERQLPNSEVWKLPALQQTIQEWLMVAQNDAKVSWERMTLPSRITYDRLGKIVQDEEVSA